MKEINRFKEDSVENRTKGQGRWEATERDRLKKEDSRKGRTERTMKEGGKQGNDRSET